MNYVCRTCLGKISDKKFLALTENAESSQVKTELSMCVPEMKVDVVVNPIICLECVSALHSAYEFKRRCLQTEEYISNYMQNMGMNGKYVSLIEVCEEFGLLNSSFCTVSLHRDPVKADDVVDELNSLLDDVLEVAPGYPGRAENECSSKIQEKQNSTKTNWASWLETEFQDDLQCSANQHTKINQEQNFAVNNATVKNSNAKDLKLPNVSDCPEKSFINSKEAFTNGLQFKDQSGPKSLPSKRDTKLFRCTTCECKRPVNGRSKRCRENYVATKSETQNKQRKNSNMKPLACNLCNYKTTRKTVLYAHIKSHSQKQVFVCEICDYRTVYKQNLITHNKYHRKRKKKQFKNGNKNVQKSVKIGFNSQSFICGICQHKSTSKHTLKRHMISHSTKKPFACGMCEFKTRYIANLKRHLRIHERMSLAYTG